jgi:carbonic anhydrase
MASNKLYVVCIGVIIGLYGCNGKNSTTGQDSIAKKTVTASVTSKDTVCSICGCMLQSPINIVERTAIPVVLPKLTFITVATEMYIQNDGHTIKLTPRDTALNGNYVVFNYEKYFLQNFHFHHKSEHLFDGKPAPMEVHFVFQNKVTKANVVVGLLISQGPRFNPELDSIWSEFPKHGNYAKENLSFKVDISSIIKYSDTDTYYSYVGSLTTPPFTEGIAWIVLKKRLVLNAGQIEKFGSYYPNNARRTYPVNNRLVLRVR